MNITSRPGLLVKELTVYFSGSTQECNSTLTNTSGTIYSIDGDGDGHYEPNLDCWWTIEAEVGHVIKINIAEFYVQYGSICEYDSLEVS